MPPDLIVLTLVVVTALVFDFTNGFHDTANAMATSIATSGPVLAQGGSCGQLWYERNEIYARNGYCFKTARARAAFGPGCFPPYGRLSGWEKRRVADIQAEERYMGCPP